MFNYLEATYPQLPLLTADPLAAARVREKVLYTDLHLELPARELYPQAYFGGKVSEETQERVRKLLVRGAAARARAWVLDGLSPAVVAPQDGGWTAIVPHGARSWAAAPFDDAVVALLGRRVKRRLLPAIGVALVGRRLVLCVIPAVLRPRRSWLVWEPGVGLVRPGTLTPGTVGQLAAVADHREQRDVAAPMHNG